MFVPYVPTLGSCLALSLSLSRCVSLSRRWYFMVDAIVGGSAFHEVGRNEVPPVNLCTRKYEYTGEALILPELYFFSRACSFVLFPCPQRRRSERGELLATADGAHATWHTSL